MELSELLEKFGKSSGLDVCNLDDEGVCRLVFDGNLTVDIEQGEDKATCLMYGLAGPLPPEPEALMRRMLGANLFVSDTGDAVVGLDNTLDQIIILLRCQLTHMEYDEFERILTGFIDQLEYWIESLSPDSESEMDTGVEAADPGPFPGREGFIRA